MEELQPDVRLHEPDLALRGGADGLDFVRKLIDGAPQRLVAGGVLLLEIGCDQAEAVQKLFANAKVFEPAEIVKDLGGRSRVVWAKKK